MSIKVFQLLPNAIRAKINSRKSDIQNPSYSPTKEFTSSRLPKSTPRIFRSLAERILDQLGQFEKKVFGVKVDNIEQSSQLAVAPKESKNTASSYSEIINSVRDIFKPNHHWEEWGHDAGTRNSVIAHFAFEDLSGLELEGLNIRRVLEERGDENHLKLFDAMTELEGLHKASGSISDPKITFDLATLKLTFGLNDEAIKLYEKIADHPEYAEGAMLNSAVAAFNEAFRKIKVNAQLPSPEAKLSPFERASYFFQQYENHLGANGKSLGDAERRMQEKIEAWRNGSVDFGTYKPQSNDLGMEIHGPLTLINMGSFTSAPPHKYGKFVEGNHDLEISQHLKKENGEGSLGMRTALIDFKMDLLTGAKANSIDSVRKFTEKFGDKGLDLWIQEYGFSNAVKWFEYYGSESLSKWIELHGDKPIDKWSQVS